MNNDPKNTIKQFLKKKIDIEEKPPEYAQEFINKKLFEEPKERLNFEKSLWNRLKFKIMAWPQKLMIHKRRGFKRFMNESFPVLAFMGFSCYMVYLMESQYTTMKDKVVASKSFKQLQIEQEDEEIRQALFGEGDPALRKTTMRESQKKQKYKFEYFEDDDPETTSEEFSTEGDLLERMYADSLKGDKVPSQYVQAVKDFAIQKENEKKEQEQQNAPSINKYVKSQ